MSRDWNTGSEEGLRDLGLFSCGEVSEGVSRRPDSNLPVPRR